MHDVNLLDETLDINQSVSYHLSIQACRDGFSFAVLDLTRNKYVALRHYAVDPELAEDKYLDRVEEIIGKDELLTKEYKSTYILYPSPRFTLVPSPLFQKDQLRMYFAFNHQMEDLDELHSNRLSHADAYLIFALPGEFGNSMVKKLPQAKFFHQGLPMIEQPLSSPGSKAAGPKLFANLQHECLDLAVHDEKKLKFFNSFSIHHPDDILFFILYVTEQLKLDPEKTECILSGNLDKTSVSFQQLIQYIRHLRFGNPIELYTYSYTFQEIPSHRFVNLLNLYACV